MLNTAFLPVEYVVVGHLTRDLQPDGTWRLGGTAAYAALTARRLGFSVGIVTARPADLDLGPLADIPIAGPTSEEMTTFENLETEHGRVQYIHALGPSLHHYHVPPAWRSAAIAHLAPVAQEVDPQLVHTFRRGLLGITPQGWLREWDDTGRVRPSPWPEAPYVLPHAGAVVVSIEDLGGDESRIPELARLTPLLVVTYGADGAVLYWQGERHHQPAPQVEVVDSTGAGDIFAAAFFCRLVTTRDPIEALRFAVRLASLSVTRPGLEGVPTPEELASLMAATP